MTEKNFIDARLAWLDNRGRNTNLPYPTRDELAAFADGFQYALSSSAKPLGVAPCKVCGQWPRQACGNSDPLECPRVHAAPSATLEPVDTEPLRAAVQAALLFMEEFAAAGNKYAPKVVRQMRAALKGTPVAEGGKPEDAKDAARYRRLRLTYYQQRCMLGPDPKPSEEDFNKAYDAADDRHYGPER